MSRYRGVDDDDAYEQAMREFREVLDAAPLLHYGGPVTDEQVARDNAAYRRRLALERGEVAEPPPRVNYREYELPPDP